jgi:hypothetical protein
VYDATAAQSLTSDADMTYEDRIVCFLDVLGFKELVNAPVRPDSSVDEAKVAAIAKALTAIRRAMDVDEPEKVLGGMQVTQFSDSITLSFPVNAKSALFHAVLQIVWVQLQLIYHGILVRGAMKYGKLVHTPELMFGPAFVDAYELESKAACYPRVILEDQVIQTGAAAHARHHDPATEAAHIKKLLRRDHDGFWYVDYVNAAIPELNDPAYDAVEYYERLWKIVDAGRAHSSPAVRAKFDWLADKLPPRP